MTSILRQHQQLSEKRKLDKQIQSNNLDLNLLKNITHIQGNINENIIINDKSTTLNNKISLNNLTDILKHKNTKYCMYKHQKQSVRNWLKHKGLNFDKINQQIKNNQKLSQLSIKQQQNLQIKQQLSTHPSIRLTTSILGKQSKFPSTQIQQPILLITYQKPWNFTPDNQLQFINQQKQTILKQTIFKRLNQKKPNNLKTHTVLLQKIRKSTNDKTMNLLTKNNIIYQHINNQDQLLKPIQQSAHQLNKNQLKRQSYFNFIQQLSTYGFQQTLHKLPNINNFWKIPYQHIKTIQHYQKTIQKLPINQKQKISTTFQQRINSLLMMKSLACIQKQYQKQLLTINYENDILGYVNDIERKNKRIKIWRDHNGKPIWALAYYLVRAKKINQFKKLVEDVDKQFLEDFLLYQQSINLQSPQPSVKKYDLQKYKDNYFNQLVYILTACPKFDPQIIDNENLDTIWILLRTLGIYRYIPQKNQQFQEIVDIMFEQAFKGLQDQNGIKRNIEITKINIQKYLYVGGYKQILIFFKILNQKKLQDDQFNIDDYVHLYTVVNFYPQLNGSVLKKDQEYFNKQYCKVLIRYLLNLQNQKKYQHLPYYLLLAPPSEIQKVIQSLIKTRQNFLNFPWRILRQQMIQRDQLQGDKNYKYLIQKTINNIELKTFYDYVFAIKQYRTRLNMKIIQKQNENQNKKQNSFLNFLKINIKNPFKSQPIPIKKQKQNIAIIMKELKLSSILLLKKLYFQQKKKFQILKGGDINKFINQINEFFQINRRIQQGNEEQSLQNKMKEFNEFVEECENIFNDKIKIIQQHQTHNTNITQQYNTIKTSFNFYHQFTHLTYLLTSPSTKYHQLKQFQPSFITFNKIYYHHKSPNQQQQQQKLIKIIKLCEYLKSTSLQSLYIYYLLSLIRRNEIIYNLQYDYTGCIQYKRIIFIGMDNIEKYYEIGNGSGKGNVRRNVNMNRKNRMQYEQEEQQYNNKQIKKNPFKDCQEYIMLKKQLIQKYNYQKQQYNKLNTLTNKNNQLVQQSLKQFTY